MSKYFLYRIFWLQLCTVAVLITPIVFAGLYVLKKHEEAQNKLEQIEPRYARLVGLISRRADLVTFTAEADQATSRLSFPAGQDTAQTGNEAQQRIRTLFTDSKLDIGSIQVLPVKEGTHFDRIPINIRVEGDINGIQNALNLLSTQSPVIGIESWGIQTIGAVRPASSQRLGAQFNLFIARGRS